MLSIRLHAKDGALLGTADIPPARAFPKLVCLPLFDGTFRFFVRRGKESVGVDAETFDEVEPVAAENLEEVER